MREGAQPPEIEPGLEEGSTRTEPSVETDQSGQVIEQAQPVPQGQAAPQEPAATREEHPIEIMEENVDEEEDDEFDRDRWVQGTVAPELSLENQRQLAMKGVFLVVATRISDEHDFFVTSIANPPLTIQQQRDIRKKGGQILVSLTEDSYDIYQMEVDPTLVPRSKPSKAKKRTYEERVSAAQSSGFGVASDCAIQELLGEVSEDSSAKESSFGSPKGKSPKKKRKKQPRNESPASPGKRRFLKNLLQKGLLRSRQERIFL